MQKATSDYLNRPLKSLEEARAPSRIVPLHPDVDPPCDVEHESWLSDEKQEPPIGWPLALCLMLGGVLAASIMATLALYLLMLGARAIVTLLGAA